MTLNFTRFFGLDPEALADLVGRMEGAHTDLFLESSQAGLVRMEQGALVAATTDRAQGAALRSLSPQGCTRLITDTDVRLVTLRQRTQDFGQRPPSPAELKVEVLGGPPERAPDLARLIALAELADRVARAADPAVIEVQVSLRDGIRHTVLATQGGQVIDAWAERASVAVEVVTERGPLRETGFESAGGAKVVLDEALVEVTTRLAVARALALLDARPATGGAMPVVLAAEAGGTLVHEAVGHALEADCVLEGLSVFGDQMGAMIANERISVIDDATLPGRHGSYPIDDEGVPAERTVLIENGKLVGLLHDRRSALLSGARANGKGRRESFRDRPVVRMSNTMILPGADDPAAILRDTPNGLYVVRMGGGEVDTLTGSFVFEANEAYRIEGGRRGELVRGATLTGSAAEVLASIDRVGSDLGFGLGWCGKDGQDVPISDAEPTLRIPSLIVGA
ncbi:MAG: TldD/PmbA family protein [Deltaproteobacteria bacterium]|jgi:TldD protein|nr:TldD/PmbA family protein [Deltaproteobacteria bacterium]